MHVHDSLPNFTAEFCHGPPMQPSSTTSQNSAGCGICLHRHRCVTLRVLHHCSLLWSNLLRRALLCHNRIPSFRLLLLRFLLLRRGLLYGFRRRDRRAALDNGLEARQNFHRRRVTALRTGKDSVECLQASVHCLQRFYHRLVGLRRLEQSILSRHQLVLRYRGVGLGTRNLRLCVFQRLRSFLSCGVVLINSVLDLLDVLLELLIDVFDAPGGYWSALVRLLF
mmetsp:Transcript_41779/g.115132  ORF Transcript_41779/g.115132 Transcript_41779/m.115132 type:complete len:224 (+) Transcript_41779:114-785(+)